MAKNPNQMGWYYNENNCIACRACEAACKQEFDLPVGVRRRRVVTTEEGKYPNPKVRYISISCNHCEDPVKNPDAIGDGHEDTPDLSLAKDGNGNRSTPAMQSKLIV